MTDNDALVRRTWADISNAADSPTGKDDEDAFLVGLRDGFEDAVQLIDLLTGGDGEYRYCSDHDPDRHCPSPVEMIHRILAAFRSTPQAQPRDLPAQDEVERPKGAGWSTPPEMEADHDERLTKDELKALGLGVSEWAYNHLSKGYAVSLTVREVKRLLATAADLIAQAKPLDLLAQDEVEVRKIDTVTGDFGQDEGEPFWRVEIGGYCADFDHELAARNFAAAIAALDRHHAGDDALREENARLRGAALEVISAGFDHYTARNGRRCSIEGGDGEKCWIVPFDQFEALRAALEGGAK